MKHFFITTMKQPLQSWLDAFGSVHCVDRIELLPKIGNDTACLFWVHAQSEQDEQWLVYLHKLQTLHPQAKVVILSNHPEKAEGLRAIGAGGVGYLHAYAHSQLLQEVWNVVKHGGLWLGKDLLQFLIGSTVQHVQSSEAHVSEVTGALTKREREVAIEAAKGLSNKEIARNLDISERTVKAHLTAVFETLNIKDRLHLALVINGAAISEGLPQTTLQPEKNSQYKRMI